MSVAPKVQVFSLGKPAADVPRDRRRYRVKWRIDGRDRTRAYKTLAEAERMRTRLRMAVIDGEVFDVATGLPRSWVAGEITWLTWTQEWLALKWPQWAGHTRRSGVECLMVFAPLMTKPRAPEPGAKVLHWLRHEGYFPGSDGWSKPPAWLEKWSIPLAEITPELLEKVLTKTTIRRNGAVMAHEVIRRRRVTMNAVLRAAVRRGLLDQNPMERVEWKAPTRSIAVDVSLVPSYADLVRAVDYLAALKSDGARYSCLVAAVGLAGMRPSEAIGLRVADLTLPQEGWGPAVLRGASTSPGMRFTASGEVVEDKALKQRAVNAVREVPLPPALVERLRWHMERWPPIEGRVFSNGAGAVPTTTNYAPIWSRARAKLWPEGHPLAKTTVYDFRHSAATTMLRASVPPAEVARRLGHSVDVLMRVYAGVFEHERDRSNQLIDQAIEEQAERHSS